MTDKRVVTAVLVVLAVLALGMTASTVDSVQLNGSESDPYTPPEGGGSDGVDAGPQLDWNLGCPSPLSDGRTVAGLFGISLALGAIGYRIRRSPLVPALALTPLLVVVSMFCPSYLAAVGSVLGVPVGAQAILLAGLLVAIAGAVALLYVKTGEGSFVASEQAETTSDTDLSAVGEAAGEAADRIETQADVSNEVYRAWAEMTRHLDVPNPETTAPDEFADAAVAAGMADEDVATLTRLFQDVRYGGEDPDARTEAAVDALRRIERTYADGGDES